MKVRVDLYVALKYNVENDTVTVESNVKDGALIEVLTSFVQDQMGGGRDDRECARLAEYTIMIGLRLEDDLFICNDDCNNNGLRLGIVMRCIALLGSDPKYAESDS